MGRTAESTKIINAVQVEAIRLEHKIDKVIQLLHNVLRKVGNDTANNGNDANKKGRR
jgi:hypothetical protein